jgi:hypothetical protein
VSQAKCGHSSSEPSATVLCGCRRVQQHTASCFDQLEVSISLVKQNRSTATCRCGARCDAACCRFIGWISGYLPGEAPVRLHFSPRGSCSSHCGTGQVIFRAQYCCFAPSLSVNRCCIFIRRRLCQILALERALKCPTHLPLSLQVSSTVCGSAACLVRACVKLHSDLNALNSIYVFRLFCKSVTTRN